MLLYYNVYYKSVFKRVALLLLCMNIDNKENIDNKKISYL